MWVTRLKQAAVVLLGLVAAGVMSTLGIWQLQVFQSQGEEKAAARAAETARDLLAVAPAGGSVQDGYGRTVTFRGEYAPDTQLLVPADSGEDGYRVLTALELPDGTAVAVVRGTVDQPEQVPAPPTGTVEQQGLLLPSEPSDELPVEDGQISSVRLSLLAQQWPYQLVPGFVTLSPPLSAEQQLGEAPVEMPQEGGRLRNGGYALQWWIFAVVGLAMAIRMSVDIGRGAREQELEALQAELDRREDLDRQEQLDRQPGEEPET
ncbi:MAG: SURF1 family protein [Propionibacteriaceae bacterium]